MPVMPLPLINKLAMAVSSTGFGHDQLVPKTYRAGGRGITGKRAMRVYLPLPKVLLTSKEDNLHKQERHKSQ